MKTTGRLIIFFFTYFALAASAYAADDSPLFEAVKKGDKAEVEALLAKGADVNAKDKNPVGQTPLHYAADTTYGRKDVAQLLLAKGADVNAMDNNGATPLHMTVGRESEAKKDIAELLLTKGADVNARDNTGWTPLFRAVSAPNKDFAQWLLTKGADINVKNNNYGMTPLHWVAQLGGKEIAEWLLAHGADVNARADKLAKSTPLHIAAEHGNKDVAEVLLAKGADMNAKDSNGQTPLDMEPSLGKKEAVELLKSRVLEQEFQHAGRNPRGALVELTARLKVNPADDNIRRFILNLASELKPAPAIPEEARKHFVEGTAIVKAAKNPAQQALAAQSFTEALKVAPWWGDAYYNLGVAQELAEKYDEAEQAFNFYLLSNPSETEKREVQDRIYGISAKRKLSGTKL